MFTELLKFISDTHMNTSFDVMCDRYVLVAPTASSKSSSLLPLMPCAVGGQAGRHGLCAGATTNPVSLRGSNYVRLDSYHSNFEAATYVVIHPNTSIPTTCLSFTLACVRLDSHWLISPLLVSSALWSSLNLYGEHRERFVIAS